MAKKHLVTCRYCKEKFDINTENFTMPSKNYYYHLHCWKTKRSLMTQEELDEEEFYKYTKELFLEDYNYIATKKLAEQYIRDNGYSYSGMQKSLIWFYEIQHNSIENASGTIGIIPYIYKQAKDYYYSLYKAKQANIEKDIQSYMPNKVKEIYIKNPKIKIKQHRLFNLEEN